MGTTLYGQRPHSEIPICIVRKNDIRPFGGYSWTGNSGKAWIKPTNRMNPVDGGLAMPRGYPMHYCQNVLGPIKLTQSRVTNVPSPTWASAPD